MMLCTDCAKYHTFFPTAHTQIVSRLIHLSLHVLIAQILKELLGETSSTACSTNNNKEEPVSGHNVDIMSKGYASSFSEYIVLPSYRICQRKPPQQLSTALTTVELGRSVKKKKKKQLSSSDFLKSKLQKKQAMEKIQQP